MLLQPDWPDARFQPLDLYGPHPADYADHAKALADALGRRPGDPDLLFLDGYALWFDGRKDDARPLFQKALPGAAYPGDGAALSSRCGGAGRPVERQSGESTCSRLEAAFQTSPERKRGGLTSTPRFASGLVWKRLLNHSST